MNSSDNAPVMVPEVDITAELLPRHVVALDTIRELSQALRAWPPGYSSAG